MAVLPYIVDEFDRSLPLHRAIGFRLAGRWGPPFAIMNGHGQWVWLSGPGTSARERPKSGRSPKRGGWNRLAR